MATTVAAPPAEARHPRTATIRAAGFHSGQVPPELRFDAWRDSLGTSHEIRPIAGGGRRPSVDASGWALDGLLLTELVLSPIWYRRRPDEGQILVRLYGEGRARGTLGDEEHLTKPGEVHLFDQGHSSSGACAGPQHLKSIFLPYSEVGYRPGLHPAHVTVPAGTATGRILKTSVECLFSQLPLAEAGEAANLAAGVSGLIHGLLLTGRAGAADSRDFHAARRQAMRRYIDEHLTDPRLDADQLCAQFAISRSTLYRDFAEEGGIARFMIRRRLERAFQELADHPPGRGRVKRVAERWCFPSPYHFSRVFRQQFGVAPSEVMGQAAISS